MHYENGKKTKYPQYAPGSAKSRIYAVKSTKRGFSKKALVGIDFFFLVLGVYESESKTWYAKLEAAIQPVCDGSKCIFILLDMLFCNE